MHTTTRSWLALGCVMLSTGCMSISYKPSLSLGSSSITIPARVQLNELSDQSDPKRKTKKVMGTSATAPGTMAGVLSTELTNALLIDFRNNQVFKEVEKRAENPELVVDGTIFAFYGHAGPNALYWITLPVDIIWFFGLPIFSEEGAVDLELTVHRPDGSIVGKYRGSSGFEDSYSVYTPRMIAIGTTLNKAFDEAVREIREQLAGDAQRLAPPRQP